MTRTCKTVTSGGFFCGNTLPCPYHRSSDDPLPGREHLVSVTEPATVYAFERIAADELRAHVAVQTWRGGADTKCGIRGDFYAVGYHVDGLTRLIDLNLHGGERVVRCEGCGVVTARRAR